MLDQATVSIARRRAGRVVLASLALFGALGAQGLRAASEDAEPKIRLAMKLEIEQGPDNKMASSPTLIVVSGKTGKLIFGGTPDHPTPDQIVVEVTPRVLDKGRIDLAFVVTGGLPKPLSIKPRIITVDGVTARIENRAPDQPSVRIDVTPSLVKAG